MPKPLQIGRRGFLLGCGALFAGPRAALAKAGHDVTRIEIREKGLVATLFLPAEAATGPAVVSLNGIGGGLWEAPAEALAREGIPALALATHNADGRPEKLSRLPIEYVLAAVDVLRERARPAGGNVVLRGWSRGGELALLAASLSTDIAGVIAYAPRTYVGLEQDHTNRFGDARAAPAFTWQGRAAEGVPLPVEMRRSTWRPSYDDLYGIAVERIAGPILLFSGADDTGLDGTTAVAGCNAAMRRLDLFKSPVRRAHISYVDAGHAIGEAPPFIGSAEGGGTIAGNAAAQKNAWQQGLEFLRTLDSAPTESAGNATRPFRQAGLRT